MIKTNPNAHRSAPPRPKGFTLDDVLKTEEFASALLDSSGKATDEIVKYRKTRLVKASEMPIDQDMSADSFELKSLMENGIPLQPVKGFSLDPQSPESSLDSLNVIFGHAIALEGDLKQALTPPAAPQPTEPQPTEPKTE